MCNLYSITTNQEAIRRLFRKVNRYVGNLASMPGIFPDYPAPVIRNTDEGEGRELAMMRWGMPPPPRSAGRRLSTSGTHHRRTGVAGSSRRTDVSCRSTPLRNTSFGSR
jgi:putative SOS response-associated peptidase YedK